MKTVGLGFGVVLIFGAWYLGATWWTTPGIFVVKGMARKSAPLEVVGVIVAIVSITYIAWVIERYRKR
jgi:hypothetical protein